MEEPLFNQLRNMEQLGYDVNCKLREKFGTLLGYSISVYTQATKFTTEYIDDRIEKFMELFNSSLLEMSDKEFSEFQQTLILLSQVTEMTLIKEGDRNWDKLTSRGDCTIDCSEQEIMAIKSITLDELRSWVETHSKGGKNFRKLSIQVQGCAKEINSYDIFWEQNLFSDLDLNF